MTHGQSLVIDAFLTLKKRHLEVRPLMRPQVWSISHGVDLLRYHVRPLLVQALATYGTGHVFGPAPEAFLGHHRQHWLQLSS